MEFILNDRLIKTDKPGGMTLLDFVRYEKHLMGTKIGCREGDCGACTILIGELSQGEVRYLSMTSCIAPLANAEGKHIVTVEGLNLPALSPVQNAFVEAGGTQCGFCTVGFVVSLTGYCITATDPTFEDAISAIDGNICRCTGYKSIERAAENVVGQLRSIVPKKKLEWLVNNHFIPEYFLTIPARLSAISKSTTASSGPNHRAGFGIVGGGTDLYVQRPEDFTAVEVNPFFGRQDISGISSTTKTCTVGAASTVTDLLHSPVFNKLFPELRKHLKLISSTQIRNMGTIGGNLVNASPIGDMTIFFLALDSSLTLRMTTGESRNVLLRDFYKKYKTIDKGDDEFVEAISFETIGKGAHFNFEKVSKRTNLDIASVNSALQIMLDDNIIKEIHISAGGVGPVPLYLKKTSDYLNGKQLIPASVAGAVDVMVSEISPISDARGSKEYKTLLLRQLLFAHFIELFPEKFEVEVLV